MPTPNETSGIVAVSSLANDVEKTTYETLIASTLRRSTWFMAHIGLQAGHSTTPLARYDIATGIVGEEIDVLPDLGCGLTGGTGVSGQGGITTSFPFVIEQGVRVSCRIRMNASTGQTYDVAIRLLQ